MDNQNTNNQSSIIEDLNAPNAEEIKGGPTLKVKRDLVMKSSITETGSDDNSLQGFSLNHNETAVSDEAEDNAVLAYLADLPTNDHSATNTEAISDLPISQLAAGEVRGGATKPAETTPSLRPPPPILPPDPPKPTFR